MRHTRCIIVIVRIGCESCLEQAEWKSTNTKRHLEINTIAKSEILEAIEYKVHLTFTSRRLDLLDCDAVLVWYQLVVVVSYF